MDNTILVNGVMTEDGPGQINYNSLANLPVVDAALSESSSNAIQNKAVHTAVSNINKSLQNLEKTVDSDNKTLQQIVSGDGTVADSNKLGGQAPDYYATSDHIHDAADENNDGFMSKEDKEKLDGIESGANKITVDTELNADSANPVENKAVHAAIENVRTMFGPITEIQLVDAYPESPVANVLYLVKG